MVHPYAQIPEISHTADQPGVVRIPVEQDVPFTGRVRALVDTPEFRRLAQITQLALTSRIYPGATHTRFEHALGVYHNALAYLWQLGKDERFAETVSPRQAEVLIVSALLHDIGHWPFCHPIEDMALPDLPPHEAFAETFLAPSGSLSQVLRDVWRIDPADVLDMLIPRTDSDSPSRRLCRSILSGPIDIDKMDYLQRDSQHCGVPYGKNFDRGRLMSSLIVNAEGDGLAITSKGRTAAEMMLFARYVMFSEVYWHHAVRSATAMFARAFFEIRHQLDLPQLFLMNEPDLIRAMCAASHDETRQLTDGLFGPRRALYKRLTEYTSIGNRSLYQVLRRTPYEHLVRCSEHLADLLARQTGVPLRRLDVLIDAPPVHREVEFRVSMYDRQADTWHPLHEVSPIVHAMSRTDFDDCVKRVRIYVAAHVLEPLRAVPHLDELVAKAVEEARAAEPV